MSGSKKERMIITSVGTVDESDVLSCDLDVFFTNGLVCLDSGNAFDRFTRYKL